MNPDASSQTATVVAATLDESLVEGKNTVWCASFLAAWKVLEEEVVNGPVRIDGADILCEKLNRAADPRTDVSEDCMYAAAGQVKDGIISRIQQDVAAQFPTIDPPAFPVLDGRALIAYAILKTDIRFATPYYKHNEPLEFSDGRSGSVGVRSFGVPHPGFDADWERLLAQPRIVFSSSDEFIIDLDRTSEPNQILVARVNPEPTLAETLTSVELKLHQQADGPDGLSPIDVLLVPELALSITHRFRQFEGRSLQNPRLGGMPLDVVQQDIDFRLNRSGAELTSQAILQMLCMPRRFVFDRPFLVVMRKRGAERPFFVMWVGHREVLRPFGLEPFVDDST